MKKVELYSRKLGHKVTVETRKSSAVLGWSLSGWSRSGGWKKPQ